MIRGTTPTHVFKFNSEIDADVNFDFIEITYIQNDVLIEKVWNATNTSEIKFLSDSNYKNYAIVQLNQEETLAFSTGKDVFAQVKVRTREVYNSAGSIIIYPSQVFKSNIIRIPVGASFNDDILPIIEASQINILSNDSETETTIQIDSRRLDVEFQDLYIQVINN